MKQINYKLQILLVNLLLLFTNSGFDALGQLPRLQLAYPFYANQSISLHWSSVPGAEEYEYRRKINEGAYGAWISKGLNTTHLDAGLDAANTYAYQVRVRVAGVWTVPSNEKMNSFKRVWPVRDVADCTTEVLEVFHGFGQPIRAGGVQYFHEGLDLQGKGGGHKECVRAPVGGMVAARGGVAGDLAIFLKVNIGADTQYISFNHLIEVNANLLDNESVAPGDSLGVITNNALVTGWNTRTFHTHCHFWDSAYLKYLDYARNPLNIWTTNSYRDPQLQAPSLLDANADSSAIYFAKTPGPSILHKKDTSIHNAVDIIAEVIDKKTTDAPWQVPLKAGYFIQRWVSLNWTDVVRNATAPYILMDNNIFYRSYHGHPNTNMINTIVDYRETFKSVPTATPADYRFEQWFTYKLTNTTGITGDTATLDSLQRWATDARHTVLQPNGYMTDYALARSIDEARFPDGTYRVGVRLVDFVHTAPYTYGNVRVDNFRPYIKRVQIDGAPLLYESFWTWSEGSGRLINEGNNDTTTPAKGPVDIYIYASEPMKWIKVVIPTLEYEDSISAGLLQNTIWGFTIPLAKTVGKPIGPHRIIITGIDSADHKLQGFLSREDRLAAQIEKRLLNGNFTPGANPQADTIHHFYLEPQVLPVNNIVANAFAGRTQNRIIWKVVGEKLLRHYEVEFSDNGMLFHKIATVSPLPPEEGERTYSFEDNRVLPQISYYRIKAVDLDGRFGLSNTVLVKRSMQPLVSIIQNPIQNKEAIVEINTEYPQKFQMLLHDATGKTIAAQSGFHSGGTIRYPLRINQGISTGIYFLYLTLADSQRVFKVIVQ